MYYDEVAKIWRSTTGTTESEDPFAEIPDLRDSTGSRITAPLAPSEPRTSTGTFDEAPAPVPAQTIAPVERDAAETSTQQEEPPAPPLQEPAVPATAAEAQLPVEIVGLPNEPLPRPEVAPNASTAPVETPAEVAPATPAVVPADVLGQNGDALAAVVYVAKVGKISTWEHALTIVCWRMQCRRCSPQPPEPAGRAGRFTRGPARTDLRCDGGQRVRLR